MRILAIIAASLNLALTGSEQARISGQQHKQAPNDRESQVILPLPFLTVNEIIERVKESPTFLLKGTNKHVIEQYLDLQLVDTPITATLNHRTIRPGHSQLVEISTYQLEAGGVPFCEASTKITRVGSSVMILGEIPRVSLEPEPLALTSKAVDNILSQAYGTIRIVRMRKCLIAQDDRAQPVYEVIYRRGNMPYRAYVNQTAVVHNELFAFDATGTATVYRRNNVQSENLEEQSIDVAEDGALTNEFFTTNTTSNSSHRVDRVSEESFQYAYDFESDQYTEVATFTHAGLMLNYLESIGYTWSGGKPLTIMVHAKTGSSGNVNNALYQPGSSFEDGRPRIHIGDGDGVILQNLGKDSDVVSHELGHHVIFRHIRSVSGESLILHEGLADFFTFSESQDTCLGESICPTDSQACYQPASCLRTGSNSIVYGSDRYAGLSAHLRGQVISGMMWDIAEESGMALNDLARITLDALAMVPASASIRDFLYALFTATHADSANITCTAVDVAKARGFGLGQVDCSDPDTFPAAAINSTTTTNNRKTDTSEGLFGCGSSPIPPSDDGPWFPLLFFLGFGTLLVRGWLRRRRGLVTRLIALLAVTGGIASTAEATSVSLALSLIWEGESIREENIEAIENLRTQFPQLGLVQFLNPAYFTKPGADPEEIRKLIGRTLRPKDIIGLHVHPWRSLVEKSQVVFRDSPSFWGNALQHCHIDCGHEIPISAYPRLEIEKILETSVKILNSNGFSPKAFLAGGWMSSPTVSQVAAKIGLPYDFSPIAPDTIKKKLKFTPLYVWAKNLWNDVTPESQAMPMKIGHQDLVFVPLNGGPIDYQDTLDLFASYERQVATDKNQKRMMQFAFYQESATSQFPRIVSLLRRISQHGRKNGIKISSFRLPALAKL